jgi:hypothetical protein
MMGRKGDGKAKLGKIYAILIHFLLVWSGNSPPSIVVVIQALCDLGTEPPRGLFEGIHSILLVPHPLHFVKQ